MYSGLPFLFSPAILWWYKLLNVFSDTYLLPIYLLWWGVSSYHLYLFNWVVFLLLSSDLILQDSLADDTRLCRGLNKQPSWPWLERCVVWFQRPSPFRLQLNSLHIHQSKHSFVVVACFGQNKRNLLSYSSGSQKFRIKVSTGLVSSLPRAVQT